VLSCLGHDAIHGGPAKDLLDLSDHCQPPKAIIDHDSTRRCQINDARVRRHQRVSLNADASPMDGSGAPSVRQSVSWKDARSTLELAPLGRSGLARMGAQILIHHLTCSNSIASTCECLARQIARAHRQNCIVVALRALVDQLPRAGVVCRLTVHSHVVVSMSSRRTSDTTPIRAAVAAAKVTASPQPWYRRGTG